jgi:uncharacterized membrane protein (UPF0127 family)
MAIYYIDSDNNITAFAEAQPEAVGVCGSWQRRTQAAPCRR